MFKFILFLFAAPRQSYYSHHRKEEGIVLLFYLDTLSVAIEVVRHSVLTA